MWLCIAVALCVHLTAATWKGSQSQRRAAEPLTTRFIKRQPRLTKPLEMKKRPRPKQRAIHRKMIAAQPRATARQAALGGWSRHLLGTLARPNTVVPRAVSAPDARFEAKVIAVPLVHAREPEQALDMGMEMVDVDALDTGQYHAMVIQDPTDKRNLRGFFHLGICYSRSMRMVDFHGATDRMNFALTRLVRALNKYTHVKSDVRGRFTFDNNEMFNTPWVAVGAVAAFEPTVSEKTNLGEYLATGGFLFADSWGNLEMPQGFAALRSLRSLIIDALSTRGLEHGQMWDFQQLPNTHPIYHCFFDFDGPPLGSDRLSRMSSGPIARSADRFLQGVHVDGRLVCVYSRKGYFHPWGDWGPDGLGARQGRGYGIFDPTRQLQFGVNLIIFALTQEGSITHRLMDSVR